jgi:hypothetical protein
MTIKAAKTAKTKDEKVKQLCAAAKENEPLQQKNKK